MAVRRLLEIKQEKKKKRNGKRLRGKREKKICRHKDERPAKRRRIKKTSKSITKESEE
jgi:hypothetical protein